MPGEQLAVHELPPKLHLAAGEKIHQHASRALELKCHQSEVMCNTAGQHFPMAMGAAFLTGCLSASFSCHQRDMSPEAHYQPGLECTIVKPVQ